MYVLGDLFDSWIGDDQLAEEMPAQVAKGLRAVADAGVPVGIIVGNRDFALGRRFADAAGATLLPEQIVVDVAGVPTLLMHGDELCTSDRAYQRFRRLIRNPVVQRSLLALPYALRKAMASGLRRKSREATAAKPETILDVEPRAVEAALRQANVTRIVHGHTHRPARHRLQVDGRDCERWVLADWYDSGSYLELDAEGGRKRKVLAPSEGSLEN